MSKLTVIEYLIKEGKANVNATDINGESCIFYASKIHLRRRFVKTND